MNTPFQNSKLENIRLFPIPERHCSQTRRLSIHGQEHPPVADNRIAFRPFRQCYGLKAYPA